MADGDSEKGNEPLQLDQKMLDAIIEVVASTLRKECVQCNKPGEHSGTGAGSPGDTAGEMPIQSTLLVVSSLHPLGCENQ